jgi:DNA mismatch endonuclease (patch repair protein)
MGNMSKAVRSRIMSAIRKQDTKPEIVVRRYLHAKGLRYRLYDGKLPGNPDLILSRRNAVVFVHGCFWHRCPHCPAGSKIVRSNVGYWHPKLERNVARDLRARCELEALGWNVLTIWECQTRDARRLIGLAKKLLALPKQAIGSKARPTRRRPWPRPPRPASARE